MTSWKWGTAIAAVMTATLTSAAHADETTASGNIAARDVTAQAGDDIVVTGKATVFSNTQVTAPMVERQSALTSVNATINELPGVYVTEGDAFGSSDWVTQITIRGFNSGREGQQIGSTIDGMPNGGSGYGGGSRANRYLDVLNLGTVQVSQGTADIASRSNEALGGTLNYVTGDPLAETRYRVVMAGGDYDARKLYARVDTGEFAPGTSAWISGSASRNSDWVDGSGKTSRDHVAAKLISRQDRATLTAYASYDDANEPEYGSVSLDQYRANPRLDTLRGSWTGIPELDQSYRSGSRALRKNLFGYLKGGFDFGAVNLNVGTYAHRMTGRGDWLPPYIVDVTADGAGRPQSELTGGNPVRGGSALGRFYYVNPDGSAATQIAGCTGQTGIAAQFAPNCYAAGSTPVQSYRHTHYKNRRLGATADVGWTATLGGDAENLLRAGLWYENGKSSSVRDWHRLTDARVGYAFDGRPYWEQFGAESRLDELMYYVEDGVTWGALTAKIGVKQFFLNQRRAEQISTPQRAALKSNSVPLLSAGVAYATPVEGLEVFGGYSQNFAAIRAGLLDEGQDRIRTIKPETANNIEIGTRYDRGALKASLTLYDIRFNNRIVSISSNLVTGIDYLSQQDSVYLNVGGIKSRGVEAAISYRVTPRLTLASAFTYNRARYLGTGNAAQDKDAEITPGAQVFNTPKTMLVGSADWRGRVFKTGVSAKYVGDRFIDTAANDVAKAYVLLDGFVGVNLAGISPELKGLDVRLVVNNLTDKQYLGGADGGSAFIGAPRTVSAAVTLDF